LGQTLTPGVSALRAIAMAPDQVSSRPSASISSLEKNRASSISARLGRRSLTGETRRARYMKK
jgi:hypothetical protein